MEALLKQTGPNAYWLPDPARRQIILTGVVFRARQEAKPKIRKERLVRDNSRAVF